MTKKRTRRTKKGKNRGWLMPKKQVDNWLGRVSQQILQQDFSAAERTCKRILRYVPAKSKARAETLELLATVYAMRKQFEEAYQTLSIALEITPQYAHMWYNRGLNGRYTMRLVQAVRDFEKAVELETDPEQRQKFVKILAQTRDMADSERALRGPDFTLEQLMEQQLPLSRQRGETPSFALRNPMANTNVGLTMKLADDN